MHYTYTIYKLIHTYNVIHIYILYIDEQCGLKALVRAAYDTLGLQTYYTAGPKETRAWTINKGFTAPQVR